MVKDKKRSRKSSSGSDDEYYKSFHKPSSKFEEPAVPDEEPDFEDEEVEVEVADTGISPVVMASYVKEYTEFIDKNGKKNVSVKSLNKLTEEFLANSSTENVVDAETFNKCFRRFLHTSLKQNNLSIFNSLKCVEEYLDRPEIIATYPDFPSRPLPLFPYYIKKNNIKGAFGSLAKEVKERLAQDHEGRAECERELAELESVFLEALKKFRDDHPELPDKHQTFLQNKINALNKKIHPVAKTPRTPGPTPRKIKKKSQTPYDLFCHVESANFAHLSPEKREKKLQKKFNKLDDGQKQIYTKLASLPS